MRFIKVALLLTNLLVLSTSLYWTIRSWLNRHPVHKPRGCNLQRKLITRSGSSYRTEFFVDLYLQPHDRPAEPPVMAFRYATPVYNQSLAQAAEFLARYQLKNNYTCFITLPGKGDTKLPWHYSISMTLPPPSAQPWIATLFTLIALLSLFLQLLFFKHPLPISTPQVVTPPPRVGLSQERFREICTECTVNECAICLEEHPNSGARLPCGHAFHKICLQRWLVRGTVCPLCNCDLTTSIDVISWKGLERKNTEAVVEGRAQNNQQVLLDMDTRVTDVNLVQSATESTSDTGLRRRKSRQTDLVELD